MIGGVHAAFVGKWHCDRSDYFGTGRPGARLGPGESGTTCATIWMELSPEDRVRSRKSEHGQRSNLDSRHVLCASMRSTVPIDFLSKHKNEEYLLVLAFDEPHGPCSVSQGNIPGQLSRGSSFPTSAQRRTIRVDVRSLQEQRIGLDNSGSLNCTQPPIEAHQFFGSHTLLSTMKLAE